MTMRDTTGMVNIYEKNIGIYVRTYVCVNAYA